MTVQMSVMISTEEIQAKVKELGAQIDAHYANSDKELVLIGLLRGSVIFMADLCRTISKPHELDFMTVSSYGGGTVSSRDVKILKDLDGEIRGKDVLVIEDIIDSGNTLSKVLEILETRSPNSIELCTLVSKPSRREIELDVKFLGFNVEDRFIVGYGVDYDQKYRHLPFIDQKLPNRDRSKTVILGSSLGGLSSAYMAMQFPQQISHVVPLSGSFWWQKDSQDLANSMSKIIRESSNQPEFDIKNK